MVGTFEDVYELIATQKAIIKKQDEIIANKDIIISNLSRIKDIQEEQIKRLKIRLNSVVNITPKTGHWIYDNIANNWRCDKCGETPKTMGYVGTADFMREHFKFCNHCGAKMESEG